MRLLCAVVALCLLGVAQEDEELGDLLDFVELNLKNLLEYGTYTAMYDASYERIRECGCFYSPHKITWGSHIGLECKREVEPGEELLAFDPEKCGSLCNDQHGFDTVLLCPDGWDKPDDACQSGCVPKKLFDSVEARVDFWDATLQMFLMIGTDYMTIEPEYLDLCGCVTKGRKIIYGSKIGFDCVRREDAPVESACNAEAICKDERGRQLVTFCPSGHSATCSGCRKDFAGNDLLARLHWMVGATSDLVKLSLSVLHWQPALEQILGCGCKGSVEQITYGAWIGMKCEIHSADLVGPECGENQVCQDPSGKLIIHICPQGFISSCELGCSSPIALKELKNEL